MPWTETRIMDARLKFVSEVLEGIYSMSELCRAYGISRKTGCKWRGRYESEGPSSLSDRSRYDPDGIAECVLFICRQRIFRMRLCSPTIVAGDAHLFVIYVHSSIPARQFIRMVRCLKLAYRIRPSAGHQESISFELKPETIGVGYFHPPHI